MTGSAEADAGADLEAPAWLAGIGLTLSFLKSPVSNSGNCNINGVIIKRLPQSQMMSSIAIVMSDSFEKQSEAG